MEHFLSKDMARCNFSVEKIEGAYHELALKLNLSDSALKILYTICENGDGCLLRDVCTQSGLSKQTVHSATRKLEQEGILFLEKSGGKAKRVRLTETGTAYLRNKIVPVMALENAIFSAWPPEEVAAYLRLSEKFANDLQQHVAAFTPED